MSNPTTTDVSVKTVKPRVFSFDIDQAIAQARKIFRSQKTPPTGYGALVEYSAQLASITVLLNAAISLLELSTYLARDKGERNDADEEILVQAVSLRGEIARRLRVVHMIMNDLLQRKRTPSGDAVAA